MFNLFDLLTNSNLPNLPTRTERMKALAEGVFNQVQDQLPAFLAPVLKNFSPHLLEELTDDDVVDFIHKMRKVVDYIDDLETYLDKYQDDQASADLHQE